MRVDKKGVHYDIIYPDITLSGYLCHDKYKLKNFPENSKAISIECIAEGIQYKSILALLIEKEIFYKIRKKKKSDFVVIIIDITKFITDPSRLSNENGDFVSSFAGGPGTGSISIGYLEELCEWLYYRTDIDDEEKLAKILPMEKLIKKYLGSINYIPTWSKKFNNYV